MQEARSCHTLLHCPGGTLPTGSTLPMQSTHSIVLPGCRSPIQFPIQFEDAKGLGAGPFFGGSKAESPGGRLKWYRSMGFGTSVPGEDALLGQIAAHGQITERKPSVPRFRFSLARSQPTLVLLGI